LTKLPCPGKDLSKPEIYASKECGLDGNWVGLHPGDEIFPKDYEPGWTNYSECIGVVYDIAKNASESVMNVSESASVSVGALSISQNGADIFGVVLLVLSLICILEK
jgi:hypothetical protein